MDSGTTFSFVTSHAFNLIKTAFNAQCATEKYACTSRSKLNPPGTNSDDRKLSLGCWKFSQRTDGGLSDDDYALIRTFPPIEFHLEGGFKACVPPEQYFFLSDNNIHCIGINKDPQDVIGANLMVGYDVVFDQAQGQMGWARAYCDGPATPLPTCGAFAAKIAASGGDDAGPASPAASPPESPAASAPKSPAASAPKSPAASAPKSPAASTPKSPAASTPKSPAVSAPTSPAAAPKSPAASSPTPPARSSPSVAPAAAAKPASSSTKPEDEASGTTGGSTTVDGSSADASNAGGDARVVGMSAEWVAVLGSVVVVCLAPLLVGMCFVVMPKVFSWLDCYAAGAGPGRIRGGKKGYTPVAARGGGGFHDDEDEEDEEAELDQGDLRALEMLESYRDKLEKEDDGFDEEDEEDDGVAIGAATAPNDFTHDGYADDDAV